MVYRIMKSIAKCSLLAKLWVRLKHARQLLQIREAQSAAESQLKEAKKIKVLFIVIFDSVWKLEDLYRQMEASTIYEPEIVVAPHTALKEKEAIRQVNATVEKFRRDRYKVASSYDRESKSWIDVKELVSPQIVFFTVPYDYTHPYFKITHFSDTLTAYVPYAFVVIPRIELHYKAFFYKRLWRYYVESDIHKDYAQSFGLRKNVFVTGYPGLDALNYNRKFDQGAWKLNAIKEVRRIIWAPHHTIEGQDAGLGYSSFTMYCEFFLELLEKFDGRLQIAFKPHPLLKGKLENDPSWGITKTAKYYKGWAHHPYGQLEEGAYVDLFLTSDALIHDSASFMAEYMVTRKPLLFLTTEGKVKPKFNSFGDLLYEKHYKASDKKEISTFIERVVFGGEDDMLNSRKTFIEDNLHPGNKKIASWEIWNNINNVIRPVHDR